MSIFTGIPCIENIIIAYKISSSASKSLYDDINSLPEFKGKVIFHPNTIDNICCQIYDCSFSIEFIRSDDCMHGIYGMSIEHPLLLEPNPEEGAALIKINLLGKIPTGLDIYDAPYLYDKTYGYSNVRSFYKGGSDEVIDEINRILNLLSCDTGVECVNNISDSSDQSDSSVQSDNHTSKEYEESNTVILSERSSADKELFSDSSEILDNRISTESEWSINCIVC